MTDDATPREVGSHAGLGLLVNRALFADECERLAEWALIGPVQRAALESFAERLLAAERERCATLCENYAKRGGLTTAEEVTAKRLADALRA